LTYESARKVKQNSNGGRWPPRKEKGKIHRDPRPDEGARGGKGRRFHLVGPGKGVNRVEELHSSGTNSPQEKVEGLQHCPIHSKPKKEAFEQNFSLTSLFHH